MLTIRGMANTHRFKLRRQLSEDEGGVVYQAQDQSGRRVELRKFVRPASPDTGLDGVEEVAYQVALDRLGGISHPSLRTLSFGGCDPQDGTPYVATKSADGRALPELLAEGPLPVQLATTLLSQLLELCELVSHVLADEGVWVETQVANVRLSDKEDDPRFVFWPSPVKALLGTGHAHDLSGIIELAEAVVGRKPPSGEGEESSHLQAWLQWLKEASEGEGATIREAREMLAAAAGLEPPPPIEELVQQSKQAHSKRPQLRALLSRLRMPAPKMPLFVLLCVMFVAQAIIGWLWVRKINENIDSRLRNLKNSIYDSPYTVERDPSRAAERGSQPLDLRD